MPKKRRKEPEEGEETQGKDPESEYIELKNEADSFSKKERISGVATGKIRAFRRELDQKVKLLGYETNPEAPGVKKVHEPLLEEGEDYKEVIGFITSAKSGKRKYHPLVYLSFVLIIFGLIGLFVNPSGLLFIVLGALCWIIPYKKGIELYRTVESSGKIRILYEGIESTGYKRKDMKVEKEDTKGVELSYRVAELDFIVAGDISEDVDAIVDFLEKYKAMTAS